MTSRAPEEDMWDDYMKTPPPSSPTLPPDASSSTAYGSTAPPATAQGSIGAGANDEADASLDIVFKTPPPSSPIPTPLGYTLVNDHPSLEVNASTPSSETRPHNHLPSNHQDIPSATSSFPEPVQRHELKWSGVLAAYHVSSGSSKEYFQLGLITVCSVSRRSTACVKTLVKRSSAPAMLLSSVVKPTVGDASTCLAPRAATLLPRRCGKSGRRRMRTSVSHGGLRKWSGGTLSQFA